LTRTTIPVKKRWLPASLKAFKKICVNLANP
jgi:hypothetical protein